MNLAWCIGRVHYEFFRISSVPLAKGLYINAIIIFISNSDVVYVGDKGDQKSSTGYCTYVGGNLVTWRSWKQKVVSYSSVEAEYRAIVATSCEMLRL